MSRDRGPAGALREVRLERFGAFSGAAVALGGGLTVVVGPNEAGKSTLLAAVGDLLWGVEARPRYAFEHARQALRIGGVWSGPDGDVDLVRTARGLFDPDDEPLEAPWGAEGGRAGWEQRLGMSHEQLRAGGRAVLAGGGDLAGLVFTAHHGSGLQAVLESLDAEADRLWRPRGTKVAEREHAQAVERAREELAAAATRAGDVARARERERTAASAAA
ncbi:AAA family ATPase, partial [Kineococcus glutinatus]|uniref:AAA family ATPase n=1 Tax=Kineococcus glutinatus TaxID=1070872 RepID=UPI0031EC8E82